MKTRLIGRAFILAGLLATAACGQAAEQNAEQGADKAQQEAVAAREGKDMSAVEKSDPAMNAAIAEAKRTLPEFLAKLDSPPPGTGEFVFKYPLGGWEHIWVEQVSRKGDTLTGRLSNVPVQEGFKHGDTVSVPLRAVSDWAYRDAQGVMQGHRTTRVLLPRLDPEQAAAIREAMGWKD